ncbi:hypothetical protein LIER_34712 [Lithospermum erythrorhizon]|uniref:DUF4283 domain-containing protein n=1 Tax=Lithospermum erythrorhizon TaxID=34254 RepID=A0AAV3S2D1_LITER
MVKPQEDGPSNDRVSSGPKLLDKPMKRKKRKIHKDDQLVDDSHMVPSVADPTLMVRVPKDHRVSVDDVLEAGLISKDRVSSCDGRWCCRGWGAIVGDGVSGPGAVPVAMGGDAVEGASSVVVFKAGCSGDGVAGKAADKTGGMRKGAKNAKRHAGVAGLLGAGVTFGSFTGLAGKATQQRVPAKVGFDIFGSDTDEDDAPSLPTHARAKPGPPSSAQANAKAGPQPKPTFAGFFKENRLEGNGFKLQFHDFKDDDVILDESDEVPFVGTWGFCLIGCFTGPFPGKHALDFIVKGWGVKCRVLPYGKGWTVFRFQNEHDLLHVFHGGPYMAFGKTLMLKIVEEGVMLRNDLFMQVPTWVLLHEVPLSVWSESGLSKISSKVGTPLYMDKVTKDWSKMNYARCLIEVNVSRPPVMEFGVKMSGDRRYVQKVPYENYPDYCCVCKKFGHNYFKCPKATNGGVESAVTPLAPHVPPSKVPSNAPLPMETTNAPSLKIHDKAPLSNSYSSKPSTSKTHSSRRLSFKPSSSKNSTSSLLVASNSFGALNVKGPLIDSNNVICDSNMVDVGCLAVTPAVVDPKEVDGGGWQHVSRTDRNKGRGGAVSSSVSQ